MKFLKSLMPIRIMIICTVIYLWVGPANAQHFTLEKQEIRLNNDEKRDAIQVVCDPSVDQVRSAFDEYMDDYHDVKMNTGNLFGKHRVIEAEGIQLDAISPKQMNLYARIIENGDFTELSVFGRFGPDTFITKENYPATYEKIEDLVMHFSSVFIPIYFRNSILEQRDKLADLREDIKDLERNISKNKDRIVKLQKENREMGEERLILGKDIEKVEETLKIIKENRSATKAKVEEIRKS